MSRPFWHTSMIVSKPTSSDDSRPTSVVEPTRSRSLRRMNGGETRHDREDKPVGQWLVWVLLSISFNVGWYLSIIQPPLAVSAIGFVGASVLMYPQLTELCVRVMWQFPLGASEE